MYHEKEVTSQVLHGKPQPKRYFNASACTIDRRKMLTLLILFQTRRTCIQKNIGASFVRVAARVKYFHDNKASIIEFYGPAHGLGGCKIRKEQVPNNAQTCDVLYLTFQRLGGRDIAYCYPTCLCFRRKSFILRMQISPNQTNRSLLNKNRASEEKQSLFATKPLPPPCHSLKIGSTRLYRVTVDTPNLDWWGFILYVGVTSYSRVFDSSTGIQPLQRYNQYVHRPTVIRRVHLYQRSLLGVGRSRVLSVLVELAFKNLLWILSFS